MFAHPRPRARRMHGPKRGRATGLGNPCPKRTSPYPHVRVNRGQPFPIAWSSGHGGPTYIVLVHAEDEDKLKLNRINGQEIPKQYLYEAPPEAVDLTELTMPYVQVWLSLKEYVVRH